MSSEVQVLLRRVALGALVVVGAAFATFELTASAEPAVEAPMPAAAADEAPRPPPAAHAQAPIAPSPRPPTTHL